ncbi:hypothetical protein B0H13DRAFT_2328851 [Mycena leptocephala]|nr:hypothetical protein B0H13DRAFT_2328851 [Mycena leptocephala]
MSLASAMSHHVSQLRIGVAYSFVGIGGLLGPPLNDALLTGQFTWWRPALFSGITLYTSPSSTSTTNMKFSTAFFALVPLVAALPHSEVENLSARTVGHVFACSQAGFVNIPPAICEHYVASKSGDCVDFSPEIDNTVSSFGPDAGQQCFIFADGGCQGPRVGPIFFPGISDLTTIGMNDLISSFFCTW